MQSPNKSVYRTYNPVSYVLCLAVVYATQNRIIGGGMDNKEVSDLNPTRVTPAGPAFAIWGLIYASLGLFCVYGYIDDRIPVHKNIRLIFDDYYGIGYLFITNLIPNGLWGYFFSFNELWGFVLDSIIMVWLLINAYT